MIEQSIDQELGYQKVLYQVLIEIVNFIIHEKIVMKKMSDRPIKKLNEYLQILRNASEDNTANSQVNIIQEFMAQIS